MVGDGGRGYAQVHPVWWLTGGINPTGWIFDSLLLRCAARGCQGVRVMLGCETILRLMTAIKAKIQTVSVMARAFGLQGRAGVSATRQHGGGVLKATFDGQAVSERRIRRHGIDRTDQESRRTFHILKLAALAGIDDVRFVTADKPWGELGAGILD